MGIEKKCTIVSLETVSDFVATLVRSLGLVKNILVNCEYLFYG